MNNYKILDLNLSVHEGDENQTHFLLHRQFALSFLAMLCDLNIHYSPSIVSIRVVLVLLFIQVHDLPTPINYHFLLINDAIKECN